MIEMLRPALQRHKAMLVAEVAPDDGTFQPLLQQIAELLQVSLARL